MNHNIYQIVHGTKGHMTVYGPGCHPQNIIWTEGERPVHKLPFGPKCHELFVILYSILANLSDDMFFVVIVYLRPKNGFGQNPEDNIILTGPGQYTVTLTGSLTKTNRENINVKYNILRYCQHGSPRTH